LWSEAKRSQLFLFRLKRLLNAAYERTTTNIFINGLDDN